MVAAGQALRRKRKLFSCIMMEKLWPALSFNQSERDMNK